MAGCGGATGGGGADAVGGGGAEGGVGVAAIGAGMVELTAVLQPEERLATFLCKQTSASLPPGLTPEHFDMKSERQLDRIALCWALVICAFAPSVRMANVSAIIVAPGASALNQAFIGKVMSFTPARSSLAAETLPPGGFASRIERSPPAAYEKWSGFKPRALGCAELQIPKPR